MGCPGRMLLLTPKLRKLTETLKRNFLDLQLLRKKRTKQQEKKEEKKEKFCEMCHV